MCFTLGHATWDEAVATTWTAAPSARHSDPQFQQELGGNSLLARCLTRQLLDQDGISDTIHLFNDKLREWEDYYNCHRPHGALGGETPSERLLAKTRAEAREQIVHRLFT